jgi:hyperosmotically inducible protein
MFARSCLVLSLVLVIGLGLSACSNEKKSPDVSSDVRTALDTAGLKDVSVSQDRDKGVVTLNGNVASDAEKTQAESIAKSHSAGQVVANQIAVVPPHDKSDAKAINSDIDKGIEQNLDAALIKGDLEKQGVKFDVKNAVVTLSGKVPSQSVRQKAEKTASTVPNVQQVVNEIQVGNQKATTSSQ